MNPTPQPKHSKRTAHDAAVPWRCACRLTMTETTRNAWQSLSFAAAVAPPEAFTGQSSRPKHACLMLTDNAPQPICYPERNTLAPQARCGMRHIAYLYALGSLLYDKPIKAHQASQEILNEPIFQIALLFLESLKMAFLAPWSLKAASGAQKLRLSDAGSCVAHSSTTSPLIATQKQAQR